MPKRKPSRSPPGDRNKTVKLDSSDDSEHKPSALPLDPFRAKCPTSIDTLQENEYLKSLSPSDTDRLALERLQSVYRVRVSHWSQMGYGYRIMLIWDHDRLWGSFELGFFQGIMVIDPGPSKNMPMLYAFKWRGTSTKTPNVIFNSSWTTGEILLGDPSRLSGHFNGMLAVGLPYARCHFTAKCVVGPAMVPRSLESFVGEWNSLTIPKGLEIIRSPSTSDDSSKENQLCVRVPSAGSSEWSSEGQGPSLGFVTGIFNIASTAIAHGWPKKARWISFRLHVDLETGRVWGKFDMGICKGFLVLRNSPANVEPRIPLQFQWRGTEGDTRDRMSGKGEITIMTDNTVRGVFRDMWGDIDLAGRRRSMSAWDSGYEGWYYRAQWRQLA